MAKTTQHNKWIYDKAKDNLAQFLSGISTNDMISVIDDILTPQEVVEISERIELLRQLNQWKTQREIAADMGISVTTVNRGARILNYGTGITNKYI